MVMPKSLKFIIFYLFSIAVATVGADATPGPRNRHAVHLGPDHDHLQDRDGVSETHVPGIDLKVFRSGTGKLAAKIATEREAGGVKADVVWVADFAYYETLKEQKLLLKYNSPAGRALPPA